MGIETESVSQVRTNMSQENGTGRPTRGTLDIPSGLKGIVVVAVLSYLLLLAAL
jgi:hypothetical protein